MTDKDINLDQAKGPETSQDKTVAQGRRRLIKIGVAATPVIMTLASRPVLAWHCKSPSAWGSEQLNPNTSIKHDSYVDETWTITNWINNRGRAAVLSGNPPWRQLALKIPGISSITNYKYVTVGAVRAAIPTLPSGVQDSHRVYQGLSGKTPSGAPSTYYIWSDFAKYLVVAQLNRFMLAAGVWDPQCVTEAELSAMAQLSYPSSATPWDADKVQQYLYNNWIVRP